MNNRGQFSIIAALFVAVILVSSVMLTYSSIRYSPNQNTPQILSAIDETNLALKQVLGFTVGYYGSVLQVTGNSTYAKDLAAHYLDSGLGNTADIRPEWGTSIRITDMSLTTNWFMNSSYSQGTLNVTYALQGLGISGVTYSASSRLDVSVFPSPSDTKVCLNVTKEDDQPFTDLSKDSFKFYLYRYSNLTWAMVNPPSEPVAFPNGTYLVDIPSGINPYSYIIQVADPRGITVAASSFSQYRGTLTFNNTYLNEDYVDVLSNAYPPSAIGTHSNFEAQQDSQDSAYDILTESNADTQTQNYPPTGFSFLGSTINASGTFPTDVQTDNGQSLGVHSYVSSSSTASKTNAFIAYLDSTDSNFPKGRTWTGDSSSWGSQSNLPSAGSTIRFIRVSYCPLDQRSYEQIVVTLSNDGNLDAYVWEGNKWVATNNIANVGTTANAYRCFDIAYEKTTGKALLVYSLAPASNFRVGYKTWNPTSGWSSESIYVIASGAQTPYWVSMSSKPTANTNEIAVGVIGDSSSLDAYGLIWNGATFSSSKLLTGTVTTATRECIAVAYEQNSGYATFVSSTGDNAFSWQWSGSAWDSSATTFDLSGSSSPSWFTLKANPINDELFCLCVDSSSDLNTAYWSGSVWTLHNEHDNNVDSNSQRCADFAWETVGSKGMIVYGTTNGQITYKIFTAPNSWTGATNLAMGSGTPSHLWVQLRTNPRSTVNGDVKILGAVLDSANNIGVIRWNGTTFTVVGANTITSNGNIAYECFELEFMNYGPPNRFTAQVEFSGSSNTNDLTHLFWGVGSNCTQAGVNVTLTLRNYQTGQYSQSGQDGYLSAIIGTANLTQSQNITTTTSNPAFFRDNLGNWRLQVTAIGQVSAPFNLNIDFVEYQLTSIIYALNLEEQWTNIDYVNLEHPVLCINTTANSNLEVDVRHSGTWMPISSTLNVGWNNLSISSYMDIDVSELTIRFKTTNDFVKDSFQIDAVLIRPESDQNLFSSLQDPSATVAIELLQNGTMNWLGENLQLTTQTIPIPPLPVNSIHVNETLNGVNQEVPFQIEDWASSYTVPLGLTSNATVFGNRQMIVFLVNTHVSEFSVWWNGSDEATQTPLAYTNKYFKNDNTGGGFISNGVLSLTALNVWDAVDQATVFKVTSTAGASSSTTKFMRINGQNSTYGASPAFVIHHGIIRDIVQQEAEWSNGVPNCPNLYANVVLTLPANASYFTYQLKLMFIDSQKPRTITDLSPIKLSSSFGQLQTENGTILNDPVIALGTQTFNSTQTWIHHWSQFTDGTKGAGIMFTDSANQMLYAFDKLNPGAIRGALKADSSAQSIQLLPITLSPVSFTTAFDITWAGAIVTFDNNSLPIYGGSPQGGLWILAELPPAITVKTGN